MLAGAYGPDQSQAGATASMSGAQTTSPTSPSNATTPPDMGSTRAGSGMSSGVAGISALSNTTVPSNTLSDASTSMVAAGAAGMMGTQPSAAGTQAPADAGLPAQNDPCSLNGRWLATMHYVTDALGQKQYCHSYLYYEIEQTAQVFTIKKGLLCGDDAVGDGDFAATVDFKPSWSAVASRVQYAGRKGTSAAGSGGCEVDFEKWYTVRGATIPYYLDPANPLPSAEQPAMGTAPGWEDWDMDGNPGLTGTISGVVTGKIFTAPRQWTSMHGSVPDVSSSFRLALMWDQDANVMSYDGSPLLASSAARAAEATLHFVQFARLSEEQAAGDDQAICANVTMLAKTLTPEAAGL
ncbi:MAG TPA: hypothetical protein VFN67_14205 [Polyangiales bacterium]|nr:hypothetical protein [Polyangiales bacterium]